MADPFIVAAGPAPARGEASRWRQVALLATAAALGDDPRARVGLAAVLASLDRPAAAAAAAGEASAGAWAAWWGVLATGAVGGPEVLEALLAGDDLVHGDGDPDAREVSRRLADLRDEVAELRGEGDGSARFALVAQGPGDGGPRALVVGRSSATYLVEPSWDGLRLVRLAASEGPGGGNRAHLALGEVLESVRRGLQGGREMPPDVAPALEPEQLIEALREGSGERDRRLLALAEEVQQERARLSEAWERLEAERIALMAERQRAARQPPRRHAPPPRSRPADIAVPRDRASAAALLGVAPDAAATDVERAYKDQVSRCHPDRVAGLHPRITAQAEGLTVALNAARDLMLGRGTRRARAAG